MIEIKIFPDFSGQIYPDVALKVIPFTRLHFSLR